MRLAKDQSSIRAGVHRRIMLIDRAGKELSGIALDLKLGVSVVD
jgi:hypothetical protein